MLPPSPLSAQSVRRRATLKTLCIPIGELWDVSFTAVPVTLFSFVLCLWIVTKALRTGASMVLGALTLIAATCNWILLYALIYRYLGLIDDTVKTQDPTTCLYFSIVTWTTLGYGDVRPSIEARLWAASEALVGHLWMAIFIGVLAIWFWQIVGTSPGNPADVRLVKHAELREVKPEISSDDR